MGYGFPFYSRECVLTHTPISSPAFRADPPEVEKHGHLSPRLARGEARGHAVHSGEVPARGAFLRPSRGLRGVSGAFPAFQVVQDRLG